MLEHSGKVIAEQHQPPTQVVLAAVHMEVLEDGRVREFGYCKTQQRWPAALDRESGSVLTLKLRRSLERSHGETTRARPTAQGGNIQRSRTFSSTRNVCRTQTTLSWVVTE